MKKIIYILAIIFIASVSAYSYTENYTKDYTLIDAGTMNFTVKGFDLYCKAIFEKQCVNDFLGWCSEYSECTHQDYLSWMDDEVNKTIIAMTNQPPLMNMTVDSIHADSYVTAAAFYTNSRVIDTRISYLSYFDKIDLSSKTSHYATTTIDGRSRLDMEKRIEYLEGAIAELKSIIKDMNSTINKLCTIDPKRC